MTLERDSHPWRGQTAVPEISDPRGRCSRCPIQPIPPRTVRCEAFDLDGKPVRVLAYAVAPSGWTEELTRLHEEVADCGLVVPDMLEHVE